MTDTELLDLIAEFLMYHQIIWFDGENYQLKGTKRELYYGLWRFTRMLYQREWSKDDRSHEERD